MDFLKLDLLCIIFKHSPQKIYKFITVLLICWNQCNKNVHCLAICNINRQSLGSACSFHRFRLFFFPAAYSSFFAVWFPHDEGFSALQVTHITTHMAAGSWQFSFGSEPKQNWVKILCTKKRVVNIAMVKK